jgi:carbamoyl-phosphate synthase large subunit
MKRPRKQSRRPVRLLILSIGSLSAHNVMQALAGRRQHAFVVGTNSVADAAGNFSADVTYLVPPAASETAYVTAIQRLIDEEKPDLVIPSRDDDILVLARMKERLGSRSPLLVGSIAAAEIMNDKKKSAEFAGRHGLPFAPTVDALRDAQPIIEQYGFPLIGKPRCGNGARGVTILCSEAELARAFARRPDLVVQPFFDLPPEAPQLLASFDAGLPFFFSFPERSQYALELFIGPDGVCSEPWACRNTQIGGRSVRSERVHDHHLISLGEQYGQAMKQEGWMGPINIQTKRTSEQTFVAFEMNGRFSGGTAARTLMGFDLVGMAIRGFVPSSDFPAPTTEPTELVEKALTTSPLPTASQEELERTGRWSRRRPEARGSGETRYDMAIESGS